MTQNKGNGGRARKILGALAEPFKNAGAEKKPALLLFIFLCIYGAAALALPMERILRRPSSLVVTDMRGAPLRGTLSAEGEWLLPVPMSEMGRWMPAAAVAIEDRRFYAHRGMDWLSVARAARQNVTEGRVVSGASTITSQVVRLAVPRERTLPNKLLEFTQAAALEFILTKDEILSAETRAASKPRRARGSASPRKSSRSPRRRCSPRCCAGLATTAPTAIRSARLSCATGS